MNRVLALLVLLLAAGTEVAHAAGMASAALEIERSDGAVIVYTVELARSDAERRQGLMGRRTLAPDAGMLFDFGVQQAIAMWMRNTYVALDMVFADDGGRVVDVIEHTVPLSDRLLMPRAPARYVVELLAGEAARRGITVGARLRLPPALRTSASAP